jgi:hypothetical protein
MEHGMHNNFFLTIAYLIVLSMLPLSASANDVTVTIDIFSGMPDPSFNVDLQRSGSMPQSIKRLIDDVNRGRLTPISPSAEEKRRHLGYRGIVFTDPGGKALGGNTSITVTKTFIKVTSAAGAPVYLASNGYNKLVKEIAEHAVSMGLLRDYMTKEITADTR